MRALDLLENSLTQLLDYEAYEKDLSDLEHISKLLYEYKNKLEEKKSQIYYDLLEFDEH